MINFEAETQNALTIQGIGDTVTFAGIAYAATDFVTLVGNGSHTAGAVTVDNAVGATIASFAINGSYETSQFAMASKGGIFEVVGVAGLAHQSSADFNGDGLSDILWRDASSDTETWFTKASGGYTYGDDGAPSADWRIAGTGDFNGDGKADILWRNTTSGDTFLYNSNNSGGFNYNDLGVVPTSWHIAHTGDFNGDGLSDILWRNTARGDNELWSAKAGGGFAYSNVGNVPTNWTIAA